VTRLRAWWAIARDALHTALGLATWRRGRSAMTDALRLIDENGCENIYGGGRCSDPMSGRTRGAEYGAEAWCAPCIAADALNAAGAR
jgi:hypothetical protein